MLDQMQSCSVVGGPSAIGTGVAEFVEQTGVDEVMITAHIFDHDARLRSLQITAEQLMLAPA
jgi:alkanesulfonate monooxygenase SsuD/methylene tetrahydromethanopterin reductase-like flavin-dependent oxidoreductase (luciferase family)